MSEKSNLLTPVASYKKMEKDRVRCRRLMGGTRTMREAGKDALPKEPAEEETQYTNRLNRSFLFNAFRKTVKALTGVATSKPVDVTGASPKVKEWTKNIDRKGRTMDEFSKQLIHEVLSEGLHFIWVDYPIGPPDATAADEAALDIRPYFTLVPADAVYWWEFVSTPGGQVLREVRIMESETVGEGEFLQYEQAVVRRFQLVVDPETENQVVVWNLYRQDKKKNWVASESGQIDIPEIPLVPAYGEQTDIFEADPPLMDLAWLNEEHWQAKSDYRNILHIAMVPFLFGAGLGDEFNEALEGEASTPGAPGAGFTLSAERMITSDNPDAKLDWVEASGEGIAAGRTGLQDIEAQMASLGIRYLLGRYPHGDVTATQTIVDKIESDAEVKTIARDCLSAIAEAFRISGLYINEEIDVSLSLDASFDILTGGAADIPSLIAFGQAIGAPPRFFIEEAQRWGFISSTLDVERLLATLETLPPVDLDLSGLE